MKSPTLDLNGRRLSLIEGFHPPVQTWGISISGELTEDFSISLRILGDANP